MAEAIDPLRLNDEGLFGLEEIRAPRFSAPAANFPSNPFEDVLSRAVDALQKVSNQEAYANQLIEQYVRGEVGLENVMVEASKMNLMIQLAVTTINGAVQSFKEVTGMQV